MTSAAITIQRLRYQQLNISALSVPAEQVICLSGNHSTTKSLLLKLLADMNEPDAGEITIAGYHIKALSSEQKQQLRADHIGFIDKKNRLLPYLDALDNVTLPCHFSQRRRIQTLDEETTLNYEAYQLMARFFLEDPAILRQQTSQLTDTEQYRVMAARALIGNPSVVLLDELPPSLNPAEEKRVLLQILSECRNCGAALICANERLSPYSDKIIDTQELSYREDITLS